MFKCPICDFRTTDAARIGRHIGECSAPPDALAVEFERELGKLINGYVNKGLRKPDLIAKMRWMTGNCEMS